MNSGVLVLMTEDLAKPCESCSSHSGCLLRPHLSHLSSSLVALLVLVVHDNSRLDDLVCIGTQHTMLVLGFEQFTSLTTKIASFVVTRYVSVIFGVGDMVKC